MRSRQLWLSLYLTKDHSKPSDTYSSWQKIKKYHKQVKTLLLWWKTFPEAWGQRGFTTEEVQHSQALSLHQLVQPNTTCCQRVRVRVYLGKKRATWMTQKTLTLSLTQLANPLASLHSEPLWAIWAHCFQRNRKLPAELWDNEPQSAAGVSRWRSWCTAAPGYWSENTQSRTHPGLLQIKRRAPWACARSCQSALCEEMMFLPMKLHQVDLSAHMLLLMNVTSHSNNLVWKYAYFKTWSCYNDGKQSFMFTVIKHHHLFQQQFSLRHCWWWLLLSINDFGQAVSPHAALCLGAGLEHALLPRLQSPHS